MRLARAQGRPDEAKRTLTTLVLRHADDVNRRVRMKVPRDDVDDITQLALVSAIASAFAGSSRGEFHSWLNTIVGRRIADYHRHREGDPALLPLVGDHERGENVRGEPVESLEPDARAIDLRLTLADTVQELNDVHRLVIVLYCYRREPAVDVADEVNRRCAGRLEKAITENNVQAIGSRFRRRLRERLDDPRKSSKVTG